MKYYVGHPLQARGAEVYRLQGGKGDGMRFLYVRNGLGLELWISLDRCADMNRVIYKGKNMAYMSPCGNVAPAFRDPVGLGFLKSFTAGFMTTCGFESAGGPCEDEGEVLPQHGSISHAPAQLNSVEETDEGLVIKTTVRDCVIFGRRMVLQRVYTVSYTEDTFTMTDTVTNEGAKEAPFCLLYHCNMGYPLLSENSVVRIPYNRIWASSQLSKDSTDTALIMEEPQADYEERCYFFDTVEQQDGKVHAGIYNPDIDAGVVYSYAKNDLPCLTEWKMMGRRDYVLGIEPGNVNPAPRCKQRAEGVLPFLQPEESNTVSITFNFVDNQDDFDSAF